MSASPPPLSHRLLLALHARWFRDEYGDDLLATLEAVRAEPRHRGAAGTLLYVVHVLPDLLGSALRSRLAGPRPPNPLETMMQDMRWAARSLRKSPGFTAAALLTLALGIGAATAVFTVVNGVLLAPLPYGAPDRLAMVWSSWVDFPDRTWVSYDEYRLYKNRARSFAAAALWEEGSRNIGGEGDPERVAAAFVTPELFDVLGAPPTRGRAFTHEEARAEAPVAVLGGGLWRRRFGGDPGIVGSDIDVNGQLHRVVGVLSDAFELPTDFRRGSVTQVYLPLSVDTDPALPHRRFGGDHGSHVVARLAPGATVEEARAELDRLVDPLRAEGIYPEAFGFQPRVFGMEEDVLRSTRPALLVLLGAAGLVLLIACGNVANLLLARSEGRRSEWAVRAALGAGRVRIARQVLAEGLLLAVLGAALGLAFASVALDALLAVDPGSLPRAEGIHIDGRVVAFAGVAALFTACLFGVVPALRAGGSRLFGALREGGQGSVGRRDGRLRAGLVATQAAMAVVLLTASALTGRTFLNLLGVDPGFSAGDVLTARVSLPANRYAAPADVSGFFDALLERIAGLPGVERAAAARLLPLVTQIGDAGIQIEGYAPPPGENARGDWQVVTEGYFETLGIPLVAGRVFDAVDGPEGDGLVINEAMARRYWPGVDPLGARVTAMGDVTTVIGVVGNVTHNGLTAPVKEKFYRLQRQVPEDWSGAIRSMTLTVATSGDPYAVLPAVRQEVRAMDPALPLSEIRTLDEVRALATGESRFTMALLGLFAAVALALSLLGVYGVLTYAVSRRTREIGLRMALGAGRPSVVGMVVRQGMAVALAGVGAGAILSWVLGRFLESMLWGVRADDPATLLGVPAAFALVALAAAWLPAHRAAHIEPVRALRAE